MVIVIKVQLIQYSGYILYFLIIRREKAHRETYTDNPDLILRNNFRGKCGLAIERIYIQTLL